MQRIYQTTALHVQLQYLRRRISRGAARHFGVDVAARLSYTETGSCNSDWQDISDDWMERTFYVWSPLPQERAQSPFFPLVDKELHSL
jgi:hypothetical protein